ncbi:MAG: esterase family protein [Clostridia bacterium]|nr:esterase family protein [Clostridia bacterium]
MKLLILLLLLLPMCAYAADEYEPEAHFAVKRTNVSYGELVYTKYPSQTTGTERKLKILLPAGYTVEKQYPVLYLLHGIGGDHNEWLGAKPDVVIGNLIASGEAPEMIVVFPNVRARANDAANPSDIYTPAHFAAFDHFINDLQNDLMPYMKANYAIAEGRENTAIAGLSMGGREALYIGLTMPDTFGYVGAFCPAPGVLPYHVEKGLFQEDEFKAAQGYETFILINAGSHDGVVGSWPQTYSETLTANGTEHIFYVAEGGHDFTVWKHGLYNFVKRIFD